MNNKIQKAFTMVLDQEKMYLKEFDGKDPKDVFKNPLDLLQLVFLDKDKRFKNIEVLTKAAFGGSSVEIKITKLVS